MVRIETNRLILREYQDDDFEQVHAYCKNPEVTRFMTWGPNDEKQTRDFLTTAQWHAVHEVPRKVFEMAVVLKETGQVVGGIGMRLKTERKRDADIGYCYSPDVWGKGIGTEAAQAMLKFGFETLKLHRIWATCDPDNKGSFGIMQKLGMKQEAHFRREEILKGTWRDSLLCAILEDEWLAQAQRCEALVVTGA
jgi:RimJ/RimL family protein N-acetyltransferase